ncbi:hypothetical protein AB0G83_17985 [Streptomyces klenkii]|uniref:SbtR family transcriptional regulator n=2 Tax=Streptomyces klenkii TaxID=1420899 RepID=UPI0034092065
MVGKGGPKRWPRMSSARLGQPRSSIAAAALRTSGAGGGRSPPPRSRGARRVRGRGRGCRRSRDLPCGARGVEGRGELGRTLLARARAADAVRPGIAIIQLLKLDGAIALATEQDIDGPAEAGLLLAIAIGGVRAR